MTVSTAQLLAIETPTVDIVTAGAAFGLGKNASYERAGAGDFPCRVFRLGAKWRVPTAELLRALGIGPPDSSEAGDSTPAVATTQPASSRPEDAEVLT